MGVWFIFYGTHVYGRIKEAGCSCLATEFVHVYFVPVWPLGTYLILEESGDNIRSIATDLNVKSILVVYLRIWGPVAVLFSAAIGLGLTGMVGVILRDGFIAAALCIITFVVAHVLLMATILGWAVIGRLSGDEKKQHAVYARHIGFSVDPADMGDARHSLRTLLAGKIDERLRGIVAMGYRVNADPTVVWPYVALDPSHNDEALLTAAFTLARLDASLAEGSYREWMEQVHGRLWQRILQSTVMS